MSDLSSYEWTKTRSISKAAIELAERVEGWGKTLAHLGVSHYRIESVSLVDETPNGPTAGASVRTMQHYDTVQFWFTHRSVETSDERALDETIVHEWLHVAMRDFDIALDAVESWMPPHTYSDFEESVDHEREGLIERLARTIVDLHYDTDS